MPDHNSAPAENASAPSPIPLPNCALAAVCAPAAPAIAVMVEQLIQIVPQHVVSAIVGSRAPADLSIAPPLPPPRA